MPIQFTITGFGNSYLKRMTGLAGFIIYVAHAARRKGTPEPPASLTGSDSPPNLTHASRSASSSSILDPGTGTDEEEKSASCGSGTLPLSRTPSPPVHNIYGGDALPDPLDSLFAYKNLVGLKSKQKGPLGVGGFGEVYSLGTPAEDSSGSAPDSMSQYAAKFITFNRKDLDRSRILKNLWQTMREMNIMMHMKHPNVMGVKAICQPLSMDTEFEENGIVLVMDKMSGSMTDKIMTRQYPLTLAEVCDYSYQILCGVSYLQSLNIMHRDLKPSNILVDESNGNCTLKICDLGLARYWNADHDCAVPKKPDGVQRFLTTEDINTPHWRAPDVAESIMKQNPTYDLESEVFSVGLIMAEMLAVGESQSTHPIFTRTGRAFVRGDKDLMEFYEKELPSKTGSRDRRERALERRANFIKRVENITKWIQHYECNPDADVTNTDFKNLVGIIARMLNTNKKERVKLENALEMVHDLRNKLSDKPVSTHHANQGSHIRTFEQTLKRWTPDNPDTEPAKWFSYMERDINDLFEDHGNDPTAIAFHGARELAEKMNREITPEARVIQSDELSPCDL